MNFWDGFHKQAAAKGKAGFIVGSVKPALESASKHLMSGLRKTRTEVMKSPRRALVAGAAGGGLATHLYNRREQSRAADPTNMHYYL